MPDSLKYQLADKALPASGMPEWFFAVLIIVVALSIVATILGLQYINLRFGKGKQKVQEDVVEQARRHAGQKPTSATELASLLDLHFKGLEKLINEKIDSVKTSTDLQFRMLEQKVDTNNKAGEERQTRLEKTVADGFRSVHKRIDKHLEAHGSSTED